MSVLAARFCVFSLLAVVALAAAVASAAPGDPSHNAKTTFRWVDEQGVIHYSDEVPAPASGRDRAIMNSQGVVVRHLEGQKSAEQAAAEAHARAEVIKQKQHDTFLVTTYTSVKDIEALRDQRLEQLKTQRAASQQYIESLKARISALQTRALNYRPYSAKPGARPIPDDLAEDLVRTHTELNTQANALASESDAEGKLRAQFQADIERYRELHTLHSKD